MPYSLTERQRDFLEYIRRYIAANESSPRLEEIADQFDVKLPTAHKVLEALQSKGYLYFGRSKIVGFFIRLIERGGASERLIEIPLVGKIDQNGEIREFPQMLAHFPALLMGANPEDVFALAVVEDIPKANMVVNDFIIFDMTKKPQPGDICIGPIGERLFLFRIHSLTFDGNTSNPLLAQEYPIPEDLSHPEFEQQLNWYPLALNESSHEWFLQVAEQQNWPIKSISPELILATALRLVRALAY